MTTKIQNFFKTETDEFVNFDQQLLHEFSEFNPVLISGNMEIYDGDILIRFESGDTLSYFYKCFPYTNKKDIIVVQVNQKQILVNDDDYLLNFLSNLKQTFIDNRG